MSDRETTCFVMGIIIGVITTAATLISLYIVFGR